MSQEKSSGKEQESKDILTIRVAPKTNQYTKAKAEAIGISQNGFLNILIDLGLRVYESDVGFVSPRQQ